MVDKLLQRLVAEMQIRQPVPVTEPVGLATFSQIVTLGAADIGTAASAGIRSAGLECHHVFFMGEGGS